MADRAFEAFRPLANSIRVRAATTANLTLATALNAGDTLDGVTLVDGMLVLVKDQTAPAENGIYVVGTVPRRYTDFSGDVRGLTGAYDMHPGLLVVVEAGAAGADTIWLCTSNRGGTLGTTALAFTRLLSSLSFPSSSTDNAAVRFDGTTGAILQNSAFIIDDSGHVTSFGGNIQFPATQVASAGANVLDDYEEGTWTPTFTAATPPTSVTYTIQSGVYEKIGRSVNVRSRLLVNSKGAGGAGDVTIGGLPFSASGNTILSIGRYGSLTLPSSGVGMWGLTNSTTYAIGTDTNTAAAGITWADISANNFDHFMMGTYNV